MTEDEMKKTWCPHVRTGLTMGMAVNRHVADAPDGAGVYNETRCLGSACSQWRWENANDGKPERVHFDTAIYWASRGYSITNDTPDASGKIEMSPPKPTDGFCGLAGPVR